jgi:hypothetical protein
MMRTILSTLLLLSSLVLTVHAQQSGAVSQDISKPTIYLTLERFGENDSVWLRLHNNTWWAISFRTDDPYQGASVTPLILGDGRQVPGLADDLEVAPEYFIEHATDRVTTHARSWCTASRSWLPPGRSVVFSFPRKDLKSWEQIYVRFTYEWEQGGNDPEHKVKFYGNDIIQPQP